MKKTTTVETCEYNENGKLIRREVVTTTEETSDSGTWRQPYTVPTITPYYPSTYPITWTNSGTSDKTWQGLTWNTYRNTLGFNDLNDEDEGGASVAS